MGKYRKRPQFCRWWEDCEGIDAVKWDGGPIDDKFPQWVRDAAESGVITLREDLQEITVVSGTCTFCLAPVAWIVRRQSGNVIILGVNSFETLYEPIEDERAGDPVDPTKEEIDRVKTWEEREYIKECNAKLEKVVEASSKRLEYRGLKITDSIKFSQKAFIGLALLALQSSNMDIGCSPANQED